MMLYINEHWYTANIFLSSMIHLSMNSDLAGNCRRKVLLELFGENSCDMLFPEPLML